MRVSETALMQFLIYQTFINITHPHDQLYLAISKKIYDEFFREVAIQLILLIS